MKLYDKIRWKNNFSILNKHIIVDLKLKYDSWKGICKIDNAFLNGTVELKIKRNNNKKEYTILNWKKSVVVLVQNLE